MDDQRILSQTDEFHDLLTDYIHGATVLVRRLLSLIACIKGSGDTVINDLSQARLLLRRAHPEIVSLNSAIEFVLKSVQAGTDARTASRKLEQSWNENLKNVAEMASGFLAQHHRVLTISYSGLVRDAILKSKARNVTPEVYLGEGRPKYEGLALARELANQNVPCTVFADSAFAGYMSKVDCVLIGADAVSKDYMLNKIGTAAILREARAREVPTAVVYDFLKETDDTSLQEAVTDYPAEELLTDSLAQQAIGGDTGSHHLPNRLQVVNRYFEVIPRPLVDMELADSRQA